MHIVGMYYFKLINFPPFGVDILIVKSVPYENNSYILDSTDWFVHGSYYTRIKLSYHV